MDAQKYNPVQANFLVGFGGPRPLWARVVATPIFQPKVAQKMKNEKYAS